MIRGSNFINSASDVSRPLILKKNLAIKKFVHFLKFRSMCKMVESIDKKDKISIMVNICIESIQTLEFN